MTPLLSIRITGQDQLDQFMVSLNKALDGRAILDEGAAILFNNMRTRFLRETDPTGTQWPKSKAALRRALPGGRGGGTLFDIGRLFRSLQLSADSLTTRSIGTNVTSHGFPYGIVHNFGLAGFPRRQFLGFGEDDVEVMSNLVTRRLIAAIQNHP